MDNRQMPPVQQLNMNYVPPKVSPEQAAAIALMDRKNRTNDLIKTVLAVVFGLASLVFLFLFVYFMNQYNMAEEDVLSQISDAVAKAKEEQALELEKEFAEREKNPYREFSGPIDYGSLSFQYPKNWSIYIASDASKGGDFEAYFNPIVVNEVSDDTINALRVAIRDDDFESVVEEYQREIERSDSGLSVETTTVAGTMANRYTGTIPDTELSGIIVIFKIRDKTAVLQTDSLYFQQDFDTLLKTVKFNA